MEGGGSAGLHVVLHVMFSALTEKSFFVHSSLRTVTPAKPVAIISLAANFNGSLFLLSSNQRMAEHRQPPGPALEPPCRPTLWPAAPPAPPVSAPVPTWPANQVRLFQTSSFETSFAFKPSRDNSRQHSNCFTGVTKQGFFF